MKHLAQVLVYLGIGTFVVPFLGVDRSFKMTLMSFLGIVIAILAYLLERRLPVSREREAEQPSDAFFVDSPRREIHERESETRAK